MTTHPYTRLFTGKTIAPTSTDDSAHGYEIGDQWIDETHNNIYTATDVTPSAANWVLNGGTATGKYRQFSWVDDGLGSWHFATLDGKPALLLTDLE